MLRFKFFVYSLFLSTQLFSYDLQVLRDNYITLQEFIFVFIIVLIAFILWNIKIKKNLRDQERELKLIFNTAQSGLMYISGDRVLIKANQRMADILAYDSAQDMVGLSMRELHLSQKNFEEFGKENFDALKMGAKRNIEYKLRKKNGSSIWCELSGKTIDDNIPADISKGVMWTVSDISKRKAVEKKSKENEARYRILFEGNIAVELIIDPKSKKIIDANESASKYYGYTHEELIGMPIGNINTMSDKDIEKEMKNSTGKKKNTFHFRHRLSSGKVREVEVYSGPIDVDGYQYLYSIVFDITEQIKLEEKSKQAHQELENQHKYLKIVIESVSDAILVRDNNYEISMMNKKAKDIQKYVHSVYPFRLKGMQESEKVQKIMHEYNDKKGDTRTIELSSTPMFDDKGELLGVIESAHDVTDLMRAQTELLHQAQHDALTDLPNRILFLDRLNQAIKYAKRVDEQIAVLFLDLDHFKEINDSLGHLAGDELLKLVSTRLLESVRQSDTVARLGGDEFAILVDHISSTQGVTHLLDSISKHLKEPYIIEGHQVYVTPSIGVSVFPNDGIEADILLKNSDAAMYKAKGNGRNNYQFFTEDMTEKAFERIVLETQLRQSLELKQMRVYYQLQIDASNNSVLGMEALIRWEHPDMGVVPPARFLPLAEETGFIIELDEWVMDESIKEFKKWYEDGLKPGILSLNLTPKRLEQDDFITKLKYKLKKYKFDTSHLLLEVTEGQIMKNPHKAIKTLREISDLGISIAIDDFGTGYSSLAYLKRFPIDKLKIDRSFIKDLPHDKDDAEITHTIISMAKSLGISVIAEGVENEQQKEFLLNMGCKEVQGYFYHKPSPSDDIKGYLIKV